MNLERVSWPSIIKEIAHEASDPHVWALDGSCSACGVFLAGPYYCWPSPVTGISHLLTYRPACPPVISESAQGAGGGGGSYYAPSTSTTATTYYRVR